MLVDFDRGVYLSIDNASCNFILLLERKECLLHQDLPLTVNLL
jgi:hypothetical protein